MYIGWKINIFHSLISIQFFSFIMKQVLIHCKPEARELLDELNLVYRESLQYGNDELDVIVDDVKYTVQDGYYQDPDEQLCNYYGLDYDQVNCIEAM